MTRNEAETPQAETTFLPVPDVDALTDIFERSRETPIVLYLHDPFCPVSRRAHAEMSGGAGDVHIVDVSEQHELSNTVEAVTGVRHESPQVFVVHAAKVAWSASHSGVRLKRVLEEVTRAVADA